MEKRIQEFIADYIPKRVTKETGYKLQAELENHIYERIDYYTEIGYSEEESLEKALKDFGDDKETKEQIKNELGEIHRPFTLADFFYISIPITIALIFIAGTALHFFLFTSTDIRKFLVIPLILWLIVTVLKKSNKIHHIVKSVIVFIIVVPYFSWLFFSCFFFFTHTYDITLNKDKVISSYSDFMIVDWLEDYNKLYCLLPSPEGIGEPIDATEISMNWDTMFGYNSYKTWIFEYSPTEYNELKNKFNNEIKYMVTYEENGYYYKSDFSVRGFDFRTLDIPKEDDEHDYDFEWDYWGLIGTNDKTHEIAFIYVSNLGFSPTFDEYFIEEDCGWRYFYFLTKF